MDKTEVLLLKREKKKAPENISSQFSVESATYDLFGHIIQTQANKPLFWQVLWVL